MLIVSDGAGILGKRVKLAFTSHPRSSTPRCDRFASFAAAGPDTTAIPWQQGALGSVSLSHRLSRDGRLKSRNEWRCKSLASSL